MRFVVLFVLLFSSINILAQTSYEEEWIAREIKCDSIYKVALDKIPSYYKANKPDSVLILLSEWRKYCGMTELLCATYSFLDLISGTYENEKPPNDLLYCLADYSKLDDTEIMLSELVPLEMYRMFLKNTAQEMDTAGLNQDEKFVRTFFCEELPFKALSALYPESALSKDYKKVIDQIENQTDVNIGGYAGMYVPLDQNKLFGNHFIIGGNFNVSHGKHLFGLEADIKVGKSKTKYDYDDGKGLLESEGFNALHFNFFYGQKFWAHKRNSFWIRGGVGGDFITAFPAEDTDGDGEIDLEALYLNSFNINFGVKYKYTAPNGTSVQPGIYYNVTNFNNKNGTNVKGNYLAFRLFISWSLTPEQHNLFRSF